MNSKEWIKELYREREYLLADKVNNKGSDWSENIKHYDNIGKALLEISKDLYMLEILKKHIEINGYTYDEKDQKCIDMLIPESDKDYRVIKEWLER